ncbi:LysE/ArgO family amino acid transporter [Halobacteriovorax sp. HLS]|uniref:LysE/ArgO family amino acid transporter n=1 Tax=Halobacteriovorax sp. HLS TaxID=2234000 RepID=UPI000FD9957F|nr:LysE family transporter [Halobacteriovorax sp. HLS]
MSSIFLEGFFLQAGLILALGAQNIFVLESGIKNQNQYLVAFVCSVCDFLLIAIGVLGAATIFVKFPYIKIVFGALGVCFLFIYALQKLRQSFSENEFEEFEIHSSLDPKKSILLALGFSLLNPHVYLDTIVLIGGFSSKFSELNNRLIFGLGAGIFSSLWFFGLASFSRLLKRALRTKKSMRKLNFGASLLLLYLGLTLALDVYEWCNELFIGR